jgi:hypothetical protein
LLDFLSLFSGNLFGKDVGQVLFINKGLETKKIINQVIGLFELSSPTKIALLEPSFKVVVILL